MEDVSDYYTAYWKTETREPIEGHLPFNMFLWGWSVVMREGSFNIPHIHPNANLSGVYYVQTPISTLAETGTGDGWLHHQGPASQRRRPGASRSDPGRHRAAETMLAHHVPQLRQHYVPPFKGSGERISVAFNIRVNKKG